ncbi:MAG: AroM family protein [bacterium]|nr:AroM family protein [bacterium]
MVKVGAITVGQSPRPDVTVDIINILSDNVELIEAGALDGLSATELDAIRPQGGEDQLVTKLNDSTEFIFGERYIYPLLQKRINELESCGVELIMVLCCGDFPDSVTSNVPLILPRRVLNAIAAAASNKSRVAVLSVPELVKQWKEIWAKQVKSVTVLPVTPYGDDAWVQLDKVMPILKEADTDLVILDCIAYSDEMKQKVRKETGKNVLCSRTTLAHVTAELLALPAIALE